MRIHFYFFLKLLNFCVAFNWRKDRDLPASPKLWRVLIQLAVLSLSTFIATAEVVGSNRQFPASHSGILKEAEITERT
jgi:hypothetical protein